MKTRQTKPYVQPAMDVVELELCKALLETSGDDIGGYGPGDNSPW